MYLQETQLGWICAVATCHLQKMVAPHDTGDLVRSLVRVPGSGSDRAAGSVCFDLGRTSTLAAAVPVSLELPSALTGTRTTKPTEANTSSQNQQNAKNKLTDNVKAEPVILRNETSVPSSSMSQIGGTSRKRPCPQQTSSVCGRTESSTPGSSQPVTGEGLPVNKKARIVCMIPEQIGEDPSNLEMLKSSAPMLILQLPQHLLKSAPLVMIPETVGQLLQERNNLRQENQILQQQLSLFRQLFRNKERLTSVVKRLGVKVA